MTWSTRRCAVQMMIWGGCLIAALSIAAWPGDLGHGICGTWGCGPPLQALIACHLAWFVALAPVAALLTRSTRASIRILTGGGILLIVLSTAGFLALLVHQCLVWWPEASEWQQPYFWQRYTFTIVTSVDVPLAQVFLMGVGLVFSGVKRRRSAAINNAPSSEKSQLNDEASATNLGVRPFS